MIFYFSGTGNSRWAAKTLAELLGEKLIAVSEAFASRQYEYTLEEDESIGFVFPTYSWGPAPVMVEFAKRIKFNNYSSNTFCYMVTTCGDDIGLSVDIWKKALGNITCNAAYSVQMPNNYILLPGFDIDSKELEEKKKHNAIGRIESIAHEIKLHTHKIDVVKGAMAWIKSRVIYPWFSRYSMSDKKFAVSPDKCTHCGACVNNCPMQNITMNGNSTPQWHGNCAMCLACIHRCPTRAIEYAHATQKKGRYFFK